jgi:hypothetical protein
VAVAVLLAAVFTISKLGGFETPVRGVSSASGTQSTVAAPTVGGSSGSAPGSSGPRGSTGTPHGPHETVFGPTHGPSALTRLFLRGSPVPYRSPGSGPSGTGTSHPGPGQLEVSPTELSLGPGSSGQLTLQAAGGPVSWSASTSSPDLKLSSHGGTIGAGHQVTITVFVTRSSAVAGHGDITIGPGGTTVLVTWSDPASSSPPPPPPTGSPTPTVITPPPTRTPTPTPVPSQTSPPRITPTPAP